MVMLTKLPQLKMLQMEERKPNTLLQNPVRVPVQQFLLRASKSKRNATNLLVEMVARLREVTTLKVVSC